MPYRFWGLLDSCLAADEAGAGNVIMVAGLRPMTKVMDRPPEPKVCAPVLDPTLGERVAAMPLPYPTMGNSNHAHVRKTIVRSFRMTHHNDTVFRTLLVAI